MNIFLTEFSKFIKSRKIVIVMDGAAWHKSDKLKFIEMVIIFVFSKCHGIDLPRFQYVKIW